MSSSSQGRLSPTDFPRIVIGNVNCQLREVFTKLAKLHVKQNFSFAIIVGDLFGDCSTEHELEEISALFHGSISVPLPTYFTLGNRPLPARVVDKIESEDEVCPNLYFLGKRGTLKTSEGIRLVALGGKLDSDSSKKNKYDPTYTEPDARALYGAHSADILITNQWPRGIRTGSKVSIPEGSTPPEEVQCLADLVSTLKPRYHLSSADFFWEREPFFHMPTEDNPDAKPVTRFINLATYAKSTSQKWMYAFTLDPKAPIPFAVPVGATASPFSAPTPKRKTLPSQHDSYRFSHDNAHPHGRPRKKQRGPPPGPESCFFCLSNPNIATHLITSIGNECYLTTARGPLPTSTSFPGLGFPSHILIIPFTHTPALNIVTDTEARHSIYDEMQRYRSALHAMLANVANNALGAVTWEISRGDGVHIHWQFLPASADLIEKGLVEAAFKVEAENLQYPKFDKPASPNDPSAEPGDYFRVRIWKPVPASASGDSEKNDGPGGENEGDGEGVEKSLILPLTPDFRFDLQFGRRVMAKLMQLDRRVNWKDTVQSQEEEETEANAFKEAFKRFDFSLE